ncbi:uncharacterized protein [Miscanthus floridulus]|uniref:uncharacterized protein isoform X2 n=1 Tax=Miscanthus floridulus TaxID=154761 RepID=UPI00345AE881
MCPLASWGQIHGAAAVSVPAHRQRLLMCSQNPQMVLMIQRKRKPSTIQVIRKLHFRARKSSAENDIEESNTWIKSHASRAMMSTVDYLAQFDNTSGNSDLELAIALQHQEFERQPQRFQAPPPQQQQQQT